MGSKTITDRSWIALSLAGVAFVAVGACAITAPDLSGAYSLVSFNGHALPAVVTASATSDSNSTSTLEVLSWVLRLDATGNHISRAVFRRTAGSASSIDTVESRGTYDLNGDRLVLRSEAGEVRTLTVGENGDKLTTSPSPGDQIVGVARLDILVFRKGELGIL